MEMKFFVVLGLGIFSIFLHQTNSQTVGDELLNSSLELIKRAAVGSKYHGRIKRGDPHHPGDPAPTGEAAPTDANVEPSLNQFSFLPPPPRRSEFPRYSNDGQSQPWQKPHQKNSNYNANWNQQPVRYDVRALSSRLHPPPEPLPTFTTSQQHDDNSASIFENRPSPIPFNPYIREYRPHVTKVENFTPSGNQDHVVNKPVSDNIEKQDDYAAVYEGNPSSPDYYVPETISTGQIETVLSEGHSGTEGQHAELVSEQSHDKAEQFYEANSKKSVPPLNLAALLAGARTIGSGNPIIEANPVQTPSKNRHNLRQDSSSSFSPDTEYYDDTLYDEFVDTYLDPDAETTVEKVIPEAGHETQTHDDKVTDIEKPLNFRPNPPKFEYTSRKTTATSTSALTATSTSTTTTAAAKSTITPISQENAHQRSTVNTPPISLSEVIQEMGISLPVFLGTLQEYGFTLKEFTAKLQEKSLSKLDFRRTNGDVKKMFAMIDAIPNRTSDKLSPSTSTSLTSTVASTTLSTLKPTTLITVEEVEETTTEYSSKDLPIIEISTKSPTRPPLIFGSTKGGIGLANKGSKDLKFSTSSNVSQSSKLPVAIELDFTSLTNNNGVSATDILQDFNSMFNFTEVAETRTTTDESTTASVITTTLKPRLSTLPIRPYYAEPAKPKAHRPLGYEHGWWNKEREVVNSRLSSTARPTLRPPYVPPPPKITDGEHSSSEVEFGAAIIVDKSKPVIKDPEANKESTKKRNTYPNNNSRNIYSKIRSGDPDAMGVATRSAIMAAGILGGVALSVFIAIFIVVKYKSYNHRNRRRTVLTLPSDSSTSSLPPIYTTRSCIALSKEAYRTSGFWNTLKKRFDPYSVSTSPTSIRDSYIYSSR